MTDFSSISTLTLLDFDDEELDIGDRVEFVTKMNSYMNEMETLSGELAVFISEINTLAAELSDDDVIAARRNGFLTYETESGMQAAGAPPTAAPAAELAWVWGDALNANNGLYAYRTSITTWVKVQPHSIDYGRGYQQSRQSPNLYLDDKNNNIAKWWTINGNGSDSSSNVFASTYQGKNRLRFDADNGTNVYMQCIDVTSFKRYGSSDATFSFSMVIDHKAEDNTNFVSASFNTRILVMQVTDREALTHSGNEISGTRETYYLEGDVINWADPDVVVKYDGLVLDPACQGILVLIETATRFYCSDICVCEGDYGDYRIPEFKNTVHMSPTGNDNAQGSQGDPVKSSWKALEMINGRGAIYMREGDYFENFDLGFYDDGNIKIENRGDHDVNIFLGEKMGTGWVTHPTHNNVWSLPLPSQSLNNYVYLHGQESGLIGVNEWHPLQRGRRYRNITTALVEADSIDDVQDQYDAGVYTWFDDGTNLYITTVDGTHPNNFDVWIPTNDYIVDDTVQKHYEIRGINLFYGAVYAKYCTYKLENMLICGANFSGLSRGFGHGSEINCEICLCGGEGSRIVESAGSKTYDDLNRRSDSAYISKGAYVHDNFNIGERCQQRGSLIADDCLYEYNGLGGVNVALGSQLIGNNLISRFNGTRYPTSTSTGGAYQFRLQNASTINHDTMDGYATVAKLFNCETEGGSYSVVTSHDYCYLEAVDCIFKEYRLNAVRALGESRVKLRNCGAQSTLSSTQITAAGTATIDVEVVAAIVPEA